MKVYWINVSIAEITVVHENAERSSEEILFESVITLTGKGKYKLEYG